MWIDKYCIFILRTYVIAFICLVCIYMVLMSYLFITYAGPVYADRCYCPVKSVSDWLKSFGCKSSYDQIISDLRPFPNVNFTELRGAALQKFNHPGSMSICNYVIKQNQVMLKYWLFGYCMSYKLCHSLRYTPLNDFFFLSIFVEPKAYSLLT